MKLETLETGTKLKVVKDIYYITEDSIDECSFMTKEELFDQLTHLCIIGDIWEVVEEDDEKILQCTLGEWKDEYNDGWFDADEMIEKGVFEVIN